MVKPKRKRPSDPNRLAASVVADAVKVTEKPIKKTFERKKRGKRL